MKQAIQLAADDLANTAAICRKSYVHEAVIDAFEKGTLNGNGKASKRPPPARQILADVVRACGALARQAARPLCRFPQIPDAHRFALRARYLA